MAVPASSSAQPGAWTLAPPATVIRDAYAQDLYGDQSYDVAPDGRFLMLRYAGLSNLRISVIQNWAAELRRELENAGS